jgi:SAM-dependent methyltransferase
VVNEYSKSWFDRFLREGSLEGPDWEKTQRQLEFLQRHLPLPRFRRVLDVCCGLGRHAGPLAAAGYDIVGVERDPQLVSEARSLHPDARFICLDMRDLDSIRQEFDAVICLWQSFGYFDEESNAQVLGKMADCLRPGGRLILDLYNRRYFKAVEWNHRTAARTMEQWIYSSDLRYEDGRLIVGYAWESGDNDRFDWQLYAPDEMKALAESIGLREILTCAEWKEEQVAGNRRRMFQMILEKPGASSPAIERTDPELE